MLSIVRLAEALGALFVLFLLGRFAGVVKRKVNDANVIRIPGHAGARHGLRHGHQRDLGVPDGARLPRDGHRHFGRLIQRHRDKETAIGTDVIARIDGGDVQIEQRLGYSGQK